jgi:septum formation protein
MLDMAGIPSDYIAANVDEDALKEGLRAEGLSPRDQADALAEAKALKVSRRYPRRLVLGADQILDFAGHAFDKPENRDALRAQLIELSGKTHILFSAAVLARDGVALWRHIGKVKLFVRPLSAEFIETYMKEEGDALLNCVGGYRLEGRGAQLFNKIEGDYFTVLGLPLLPLLEQLRNYGMLMR